MIYLGHVEDNHDTIEALGIRDDDIRLCTEDLINQFTQLKKLEFNPWRQQEGWIDLPAPFSSENIKNTKNIHTLSIKGVRPEGYKHFNLKALSTEILAEDLPTIINQFPDLEVLKILVRGDLTLDESLLSLKKLRKLFISFKKEANIFYKITDLSQMENLVSLSLEKLQNSEVSPVWCSCANLSTLVLRDFNNFVDFPKEIQNLTHLEKLYLFNLGTPKMPESFSLLKSLRLFSSFRCDFEDIAPLTKLNNLSNISINYGKLTTVADFSHSTTLKEFTVEDTAQLKSIEGLKGVNTLKWVEIPDSRVADLSPLNDAKELETLNLCNAKIDKNRAKLLTQLLALSCFDNLEEMLSLQISTEQWQTRDREAFSQDLEQALKKEKSRKVVKKLQKIKPGEANKFEKVCLSIQNLKEEFAEDIEKTQRDVIPILDNLLTLHLGELSEKTLIHLINISFVAKDLSDNYELTMLVLNEAIKRKSVAVQTAMVNAFIKAHENYSAGHREWNQTVYDCLIEDIFAQFEEGPLATMLLETDVDLLYINSGDRLGLRFYDYFEKTTDKAQADKVFERYKPFIFMELKYFQDGAEDRQSFLNELINKPVSGLVKDEMSKLLTCATLFNQYLEELDVQHFEDTLKGLNHTQFCTIIENVDWDSILDDLEDDLCELDYHLVHALLEKNIAFGKTKPANALLVGLLYLIDKNKAQVDIARALNHDASLIQALCFLYNHNVSDNELEAFKASMLLLK